MGSFNMTCNLSGEVIGVDDEVVVIPLTKKNSQTSFGIYSWDFFSPIPLLLEGSYTGYGGLKNVKVFDSMNSLTEEEKIQSEKILLNYLKENCRSDNTKLNDLDDFIGVHTTIIKKDFKATIAGEYLKMLKEVEITAVLKDQLLKLLKGFGFESEKNAKEYYEKNKNEVIKTPITFVIFNKDKLKTFLDNYGKVLKKDENENIHAEKLQKQRKGLDSSIESVKFVSGSDYAGSNLPSFSWKVISKETKDKIKNKDGASKLHQKHGIDLALINDYFTLLGKSWMPSVSVNEDIEIYGHGKALEMQELLVTKDSSEKKKLKR